MSTTSTADTLLSGPRGRRMLLDYVMDAERIRRPEPHDDSFRSAVFLASHHLDPERDSSVTYSRVAYESGAEEPPEEPVRAVVTADDVAHRLSEVPLPEVTEVALRSALAAATDTARYWQDPDGEDILVATEPVRRELRRVAEHIARSPRTHWWTTALAETDQWVIVSRDDDSPETFESTAAELLSDWHEHTLAAEARAADRPTDPKANWSGYWWSNPSVRCSTRTLFDGTPAELWFVEDGMGWKRIAVRQVDAPARARIYEIDGAQAWAELCRRFPSRSPRRNDTTGTGPPDDQGDGSSPTGSSSLRATRACISPLWDTWPRREPRSESTTRRRALSPGGRPTQHAGSLTPTASATNPVPGCSTTAENTPTGSKKRNNE